MVDRGVDHTGVAPGEMRMHFDSASRSLAGVASKIRSQCETAISGAVRRNASTKLVLRCIVAVMGVGWP